VREDERRGVVVREADDRELHAVEREGPALRPLRGWLARGRVDDVRGHVFEVRSRDERLAEVLRALVEVVVAQAIEIDAHEIHDVDRRRVAEERADRWGRTDRVAGGDRDRPRGLERLEAIEPRLEEGRATDRVDGVDGSR